MGWILILYRKFVFGTPCSSRVWCNFLVYFITFLFSFRSSLSVHIAYKRSREQRHTHSISEKKIISQSYNQLVQKTHLDSEKYHPVSHVMSRKSSNSFTRSMTNPRTGSKNFKNKQFVIHHPSLWQLAHQIGNETTINYSANATSQSSLPNCRQLWSVVGKSGGKSWLPFNSC